MSYSTLSEAEKKAIIDRVWEQRQKAIADALKEVRGDILFVMMNVFCFESFPSFHMLKFSQNVSKRCDLSLPNLPHS